MKQFLILFILGIQGLFSADTVYETLFTNQAVSVNKGISAKSSIGQTSHQAVLIFKNSGGVCSPSSVIYLEGSNNNTDWIPFGTNSDLKQANTQLNYLVTGQGFFPYIRVRLIGVGANCVVDGYYTGSVNAPSPTNPSVTYETLFTNQAVAIDKNVSAKLSIGQTGHQAIVIYKDSGGVCSPSSVIYFEGSYDNTTWVPFGINSDFKRENTQLTYQVTGQGYFPNIRLHVSNVGVNCVMDGYYTGTSASNIDNQSLFNSTYQTLFVDKTTAPQVTNIAPTSSIGQAGHSMLLVFKNAPAHICSSTSAVAYMEGSYDGTTWVSFGSGNPYVPNFATKIVLAGQGAYPRIRLNLSSFDTVNCTVSAYYTGSVNQAPIISIQGVGDLVANANATSPIYVGGKSSAAIAGYGPTIKGVIACDQSLHNTATAGTTVSLLDIPFTNGVTTSLYICSFSIAGGVAGTVGYIDLSNTAACGGGFSNVTPQYVLGTGNVTVGSGLGQIAIVTPPGPTNGSLCLVAAGGKVDIMMSYAIF